MKEQDVRLAASLYKVREDLLFQIEVMGRARDMEVKGAGGVFYYTEGDAELQAAKFAILALFEERLRNVNDIIYKL
jgi:hypothetical protein